MGKLIQNDFSHIAVLVTGTGGTTGQGILQSLRTIQNRPQIIASDISHRAPGFYWADKSFVLPHSSQTEEYLRYVKEICKRYKIEVILPGSDGEARILTDSYSGSDGIFLAASSNKL